MKGSLSSGNLDAETSDSKEEINDLQRNLETSDVTSAEQNLQEDDEVSDILPFANTESEIVVPLRPKRKASQQQQSEQGRNDVNNAFVEWVAMKKQNTQKSEEYEQRDPDLLFFKSLLPDLKKLNDKRRRVVKMKIMQLINEQLDEAERDARAPFSPWDSSTSSSTHLPISISIPTTLDAAHPTECHLNPSTFTSF